MKIRLSSPAGSEGIACVANPKLISCGVRLTASIFNFPIHWAYEVSIQNGSEKQGNPTDDLATLILDLCKVRV